MITDELLISICPQLPVSAAGLAAPRLYQAAERFGINTPMRVAHFLAQLGHESGFVPKAENLNYSAQRLCVVWPTRFPTLDDAKPYEYNPRKLANKVYSKRMGNGDEASGDGWKYRGRGFIQITFRANYRTYGQLIGYDIEQEPDLALQYGVGGLIAAAFWKTHGLNGRADHDDLPGITRAINGGLTGLAERAVLLTRAKRALGI